MKVNDDVMVIDPHHGRHKIEAGQEVPEWAEKIIPADKLLIETPARKAPAKKAAAKKASPSKKAPAKETPSAPSPSTPAATES